VWASGVRTEGDAPCERCQSCRNKLSPHFVVEPAEHAVDEVFAVHDKDILLAVWAHAPDVWAAIRERDFTVK
jgi:hypothetical protein